MSFPSRNGSIHIRWGGRSVDQPTNNSKIVYVDSSKSPAELVFFRESFEILDAHYGTNWKRSYTKLINGFQYRTIDWQNIPGFLPPGRNQGYIAAILHICDLLQSTFEKMPAYQIELENVPTKISKLASYAKKVHDFRERAILDYAIENDNYDYDYETITYVDHGHQFASDTWENTAEQLETLQKFLIAKIPVVEIKLKIILPIPCSDNGFGGQLPVPLSTMQHTKETMDVSVPIDESTTTETKGLSTRGVFLIILAVLITLGIAAAILYLYFK